MAARERREDVLKRLERDQVRLAAFMKEWNALDALVYASFSADELTEDDYQSFQTLRDQLNRALPFVTTRLGPTAFVLESYGRQTHHGVFGFLLRDVAQLHVFFEPVFGQMQKDMFFRTRAMASAKLQQALGTIEAEAERIAEGPDIIEPLRDVAARLGASRCLERLDAAEGQFLDGNPTEAIHDVRLALESCAKVLANRLTDKSSPNRAFKDAVDILVSREVIDASTGVTLKTNKIGAWGWLSEHGSHDDDESASGEAIYRTSREARYALDWARASIELLLTGVEAQVADD